MIRVTIYGAIQMIFRSTKSGFTLVELLVVVSIIGMIMAVFVSSFHEAEQRTKIAKAETEVKEIHKAILAYENEKPGGLTPMYDKDATKENISFLLGMGGSNESGKIPSTLMARISDSGAMIDPWGTPYRIVVKKGSSNVKIQSAVGMLQTGYHLPNFYRLSPEERK